MTASQESIDETFSMDRQSTVLIEDDRRCAIRSAISRVDPWEVAYAKSTDFSEDIATKCYSTVRWKARMLVNFIEKEGGLFLRPYFFCIILKKGLSIVPSQ